MGNNPVNLIDPTGHYCSKPMIDDGDGYSVCSGGSSSKASSTSGTTATTSTGSSSWPSLNITANYGLVNTATNHVQTVVAGGSAQVGLLGATATYDTLKVKVYGQTGGVVGVAGDATVEAAGASVSAGLIRSVTLSNYRSTANSPNMAKAPSKEVVLGASAEAHLVRGSVGGDILLGPIKLGLQAEACAVCIGATAEVGTKGISVGAAVLFGARLRVRWGIR